MIYHEGKAIDAESGQVVWRQHQLAARALSDWDRELEALGESLRQLGRVAAEALVPVLEEMLRALQGVDVTLRRWQLQCNLSGRMPGWLARIAARLCPERWLPLLDLEAVGEDTCGS